MLQPDPGQLLSSVRRVLKESVLSAVDDPIAKRQIKAMLHLLGRLSRCWDLSDAVMAADNRDIEAVLARMNAHLTKAGYAPVVAADNARKLRPSGVNEPGLAASAARNLALCEALEFLEKRIRTELPNELAVICLADLHRLFERMTVRESVLAGDVSPSRLEEI